MEILTMRFPHLSEMIFDHLDNQSLANCNIVSKTWSIYIKEQKFYAIRIIKETVLNVSNKLSKPWFEVFKKANTDNLMEVKFCLDQFLKENCFGRFLKESQQTQSLYQCCPSTSETTTFDTQPNKKKLRLLLIVDIFQIVQQHQVWEQSVRGADV